MQACNGLPQVTTAHSMGGKVATHIMGGESPTHSVGYRLIMFAVYLCVPAIAGAPRVWADDNVLVLVLIQIVRTKQITENTTWLKILTIQNLIAVSIQFWTV